MIALRLDSRILGKVDSEDILQDACVGAVRRFRDYLDEPSVPFFVWLRQITSQVLIDTHRRYLGTQMRDASLEVTTDRRQSADASSTSFVAQLADSLTTPSQFAVRREDLCALRTALEQLAEIDREVLVLRHLEELTNNEVAQVLGIEKCAASKRYLRALQRLRNAIPMLE
jgi:RNA polymerase sigma-70 factor (ECF subfamily)